MKLINKYANSRYSKMNEYYCEITTELDKLAGLDPNGHWKHYVLCDYEDGCLPIRIPGGTLGSIEYDENSVITKIHVCTDYVVKTYPDDVNEQTLWWINKALSYSGYPSHVGKQKIKEHIKEIETMENNKVRQFIDLLVNEEETIENAAKVSGIGDMKLVDVLKTISEMEFESIKAFSSAVAGMNSMKEAIHTVKDLDDALVELKKSSEK